MVTHYPNIGVSRNITFLNYDSIGNYVFENPAISINANIFPANYKDSCEFTIEHIIGTGSNDFKNNDTLIKKQRFFSHFSYDDGSVESAYGINVSGALAAYQFKLNRPDTLRAVQIYFPQMLDSVNQIDFKLTVWDDNNGSPLLYNTAKLSKKVAKKLPKYDVHFAMRYQNPSIEIAIKKIMEKNPDEIVILPLFPHYASATTGSVYEEVSRILSKQWVCLLYTSDAADE